MADMLNGIINEKQAKIEKIKDRYNSLIAKYFTTQEENTKKIREIEQKLNEYKEKKIQLREKIAKINADFDNFLNSLQTMKQYGVFKNDSSELIEAQAKKDQINEETAQEISKQEELEIKDNNKIKELTVINEQIEEAIKGLQTNLEKVLSDLEKDVQGILTTISEMSSRFDEQVDSILLTISKLDLEGIIESTKDDEKQKDEKEPTSPTFDISGYEDSTSKIFPETTPLTTPLNVQTEDKKGSIVDLGNVISGGKNQVVADEVIPVTETVKTSGKKLEESMTDFDLSKYDRYNDSLDKIVGRNDPNQYFGLDKMNFTDEEEELIINIMPPERFNQVINVLNNYGIDFHDLNGVESFVEKLLTVDPKILDQNLNLLRSVGKNNYDQDLLFNLNYIFSVTPEQISENIRTFKNGNTDFKTVSILRICYGQKLKRNIAQLRSDGIDYSEVGRKLPISSVLLEYEDLLNHMKLEQEPVDYSSSVSAMGIGGN